MDIAPLLSQYKIKILEIKIKKNVVVFEYDVLKNNKNNIFKSNINPTLFLVCNC